MLRYIQYKSIKMEIVDPTYVRIYIWSAFTGL